MTVPVGSRNADPRRRPAADRVKQTQLAPFSVETQYLASPAYRRDRYIRCKETQNVASLRRVECAKQSQSAGTPPSSPRETKPTEAAGGVCGVPVRADTGDRSCETNPSGALLCRDAISCVSGVSTGPVYSMQGDAKCCVSTKGRVRETKPIRIGQSITTVGDKGYDRKCCRQNEANRSGGLVSSPLPRGPWRAMRRNKANLAGRRCYAREAVPGDAKYCVSTADRAKQSQQA